MPKVVEVQRTKEFAYTFLNDIFLRMAVNRVLDAAPGFDLVRCKECKYWDKATVNKKGFLICPASGMEIMAKDFCSYGERRTNGNL